MTKIFLNRSVIHTNKTDICICCFREEYIFTFPRVLEADSKTSFCLILNDLDSLKQEQAYTVNVNLRYLPSDGAQDYMTENYDFMFGAVNTDGGNYF
jgi:hypothetical protein